MATACLGGTNYHLKMSFQKFIATQREAIWRAYGEKCVYSRHLLDVSNFHIDHIVPETLANNPVELAKALDALGLASTFDLFGWENLVPCMPGMNLQKSSLVFEPNQARYFLGIAAARKPSVIEELGKIERRSARGRAIVMIQQLLVNGKLTPEAASDMIRDHISEPQEIFQLLEAMEFSDSDEIRAVSRNELDELRDRPIKFGPNHHIAGLDLTGPENKKRFCRTCREYETALREGYFPFTNYDINISTWFEHQCGLLRALLVASAPTKSYVSEPHFGILDLNLLPYSFFPVLSKHEIDAASKTYQDKLDSGELIVKRLQGNLLKVEEPEGMGQVLIEVTRADFDGNGIEDILLFEYCYATHGTMAWGNIKLMTRLAADAKFSNVTTPSCDTWSTHQLADIESKESDKLQ